MKTIFFYIIKQSEIKILLLICYIDVFSSIVKDRGLYNSNTGFLF